MLFRNDFYRSFDALSRRLLGQFEDLDGGSSRVANPTPRLNLRENPEGYTVEMALPGYSPESIEVKVEDEHLIVSGERAAPQDHEKRKYSWAERSFGKFTRRVHLGRRADRNGIQATYKHGLLTIAIPKTEEAKPRTIAVQVK
jgi:HSP20 family protein